MNRHYELYNSCLHSNAHRAVASVEKNGKSKLERYFETFSFTTACYPMTTLQLSQTGIF